MKFQVFCTVAILSVSGLGMLRADVIDQIPTPFVTHSYGGPTRAYSQYDTGLVTPPDVRNFFTVYDNLTFNTTGVIDSVSWVGGYDTPEVSGATFEISFYDSVGGAPGALLQQYVVGNAAETPMAGFPTFFNYSTTATPFNVTAGTEYWMSVVGVFDYAEAGWGLAFSDIGDNLSVQDYQEFVSKDMVRQVDAVDYAVRVSAVPEPSSAFCLLALAGAAGFRRRRSV